MQYQLHILKFNFIIFSELQKLKTIKAFLLGLFLSVSLLAQTDSTMINNRSVANYNPFNKKNEMVFESNVGETIRTVERFDSLLKVTNKSDKFTYIQTFQKRNDGIYLIRTEQHITTFFYSKDVDITYSEPILQIPEPLKAGDMWSWSGYQVKNGDTTKISILGEAITNETIELPAGKFETLKIRLFFQEKDGEETELYQWLDRELGSVKTKAIINGSGIMAFAMSLLGYDEIDSELKEIRYLESK